MVLEKPNRLFGGYAAKAAPGLGQMGLDCILTDPENPGDFLYLMVPGCQAQDFLLALRKRFYAL